MKTMSKNLWLFVALLVFAASSAFAATQNAVVYGTVYDATGNPLPGVSVSLDNPALGFARSTTTGSDGSYNFAEVPPAEGYRLTAARGGNKIDIRSGITVNVGDERVILPPLKEQPIVAAATGAKQEVKETKLESQGVRNETATAQSGVITGDQLRTLPLYNRNFLVLGLLTPNSHDADAGSNLSGGSFSVAGNRPSSNNFLLDGTDNVAASSNQAIPFQVNDAVQEFRVISSTANAEYGRNGGGTINVVTRRGGNKFHGSAFGYFSNDALNAGNPVSVYGGSGFDAAAAYAGTPAIDPTNFTAFPLRYNDYVNSAANNGFCTDQIGSATTGACGTGANTFFDPNAVMAGHDHRNQPWNSKQFGINAGGALKKDKWFYFGSYESTLIDNPNPIFERVPTAFDRTYDPYGTGAFNFTNTDPNYVLGQNILSLFPQSNVVGVPGVLEFYQGTAPNYTNVHNFLLRSDVIQTEKTSWNLRYAIQTLDQLHDDTLPKQSQYPGNGANRNALNHNATVSMAHSFTNALINEARFAFTRFDVTEEPQDHHFDATSIGMPYAQMMTTQLTGIDTQYSGAEPGVGGAYGSWAGTDPMDPTLAYLFPYARLGAPATAPSSVRDTTWLGSDSLSWTKGRHSFKFGAEYRHLNDVFSNSAYSRGLVYSSDIGEFTSDSQSATNSFTTPSFDFASKWASPYKADLGHYAAGVYAQDTWRIHPRLTMSLGVRWEYFSVPSEQHHQLWNFDPQANGLVQEGGTTAFDQYGNVCANGGNVVWDSIPQSISFTETWNCNSSTNGSAKLMHSDKNNFAPRFGVSWDVFGTGKTILRAATGMFYDQTPVNNLAQLMFNRPTALDGNNPQFILGRNELFGAGGYGNTSVNPAVITANATQADQSTVQPFVLYAFDTRHTDTPYTVQTSANLQQQVSSKVAFEFGYVGTRGYLLPVVHNANFLNNYTDIAFEGDNLAKAPALTVSNRGTSNYDSLLARVRVDETGGLRLNLTYNYSKATDNTPGALLPNLPFSLMSFALGPQYVGTGNLVPYCLVLNIGCGTFPLASPDLSFASGALTTTGAGSAITSRYLFPQDPINYLTTEQGNSDYDSHHKIVMDYTWDLPFSKKSMLLNHWTLSGIYTYQTGQPYTIFAGPIYGEAYQRVDQSGNIATDYNNPGGAISTSNLSLASNNCIPAAGSIDVSVLRPTPTSACTGSSKRNAFHGPDYNNMNFAIQKGFQVFGEGRMLTFRSEFYNLFDRANYYNPISAMSTDGFSQNPNFGKIKSAHDPRQIQFAVRFNW